MWFDHLTEDVLYIYHMFQTCVTKQEMRYCDNRTNLESTIDLQLTILVKGMFGIPP
jgi:hypothetical protein